MFIFIFILYMYDKLFFSLFYSSYISYAFSTVWNKSKDGKAFNTACDLIHDVADKVIMNRKRALVRYQINMILEHAYDGRKHLNTCIIVYFRVYKFRHFRQIFFAIHQ